MQGYTELCLLKDIFQKCGEITSILKKNKKIAFIKAHVKSKLLLFFIYFLLLDKLGMAMTLDWRFYCLCPIVQIYLNFLPQRHSREYV